jgi:hypothetical protein
MSEALQIVLLVITILVIAFGIVYLALRWAMRLGKR